MSSSEATASEPTAAEKPASEQKGRQSSAKLPLTVLLVLGCAAVGAYAAFGPSGTSSSSSPSEGSVAPTPADGVHSEQAALSGTVREVIQVANYTYLRVEPKGGPEFWAAVTKATVDEGSAVSLDGAELMTNFESKELDRVFDRIYFGRLSSGAKSPHEGDGFAPPTKEEGEAARRAASMVAEEIPIVGGEKAEGPLGRTVEEIHEDGATLSGKKVRVRGTVVKLTRKVMGTNFLHIRDGSGEGAKETHDLVLKVAEDPPSLGSQALFEGTVASNVDLGAGYNYPVLIEEGRVVAD